MSTVLKCKKCGGYIITSYNSMFPPEIGENDKRCSCKFEFTIGNFPVILSDSKKKNDAP